VYRTADGQELVVVDGHIHLWDARPENRKTAYGWIRCFYDYTVALSPAEYVWPFERYCYYGADALTQDVFVNGYVDVGIFASTYLHEFFVNGVTTHAQNFLSIPGNLVGSYSELTELLHLAATGQVKLATQVYRLEQINEAMHDLAAGRVRGRAVLVP
jgi:hypothetical protein